MPKLKPSAVRVAALLLPTMAGATAPPPPAGKQYEVRCRLVRLDGTEVASPKVMAVEGQVATLTAGGQAFTSRQGVELPYGTSLSAWVKRADDGKLLVDLTITSTSLDMPEIGSVAVAGYTVRTVRTATSGQPIQVSIGPTRAVTCDITVYDVGR